MNNVVLESCPDISPNNFVFVALLFCKKIVVFSTEDMLSSSLPDETNFTPGQDFSYSYD